MAHRIKVISVSRPRVDLDPTVQKPELLRSISRATSLVEGMLDLSLRELRDQIIINCRSGRAVHIEGLGTWSPNIALDGTFDLQYRADPALVKGMNEWNFTGRIRNRRNIGKTGDELVAQWNAEHPEDPVIG